MQHLKKSNSIAPPPLIKKKKGTINSSSILLLAFATAFFSRVADTAGFPSIINFAHFATVPVALVICLGQAKVTSRLQGWIAKSLLIGIWVLLLTIILSALINGIGVINALISFLILSEPFIFLAAFISISVTPASFEQLE
ncbi:MAG: hypothetical protein AAFY72_07825, partial [Cyanobacteria bacterium J06649_4]